MDENETDFGTALQLFLLNIVDKLTEYWGDELMHERMALNYDIVHNHLMLLDETVKCLRAIEIDCSCQDREDWGSLASVFSEIYMLINSYHGSKRRTLNIEALGCGVTHTGDPGQPMICISSESLEDMYAIGLSCKAISVMLGVSRWTIKRRTTEFCLQGTHIYDDISQEELDKIVKDYQEKHVSASGKTILTGHIRSLGLRVQRRRVRETLLRIDPRNSALRWGAIIRRRKYFVPWPNSLWHLDDHHSLIRWKKIVVHGCIDGFSRRIMYLKCADNNLSETVLDLFLQKINANMDLWPSRIRIDYGVENVLVCDAMVEMRGSGRASFIAGPSTHNQRIERLWRDVFRCVTHHFYYIFNRLEDSGLLNVESELDMFSLHYTFIPRVNHSLREFMNAFNHNRLRSCGNNSPYQLWFTGMLNEDNPLKDGLLDQDPPDFGSFGVDPDAPSPFETGNNNVTVDPVALPVDVMAVQSHLRECINPLVESQDMGVDIYIRVKNEIERLIQLPEMDPDSM